MSFRFFPRMRRTLKQEAQCRGIGVHSGQPATLTFRPAPFGQGILFLCPEAVPALWQHVGNTRLSTQLVGAQKQGVSMVEHMMAAFMGLGLTDVTVTIQGPEAPILDGSAKNYIGALQTAGWEESIVDETLWIEVSRPLHVEDGGQSLSLRPCAPGKGPVWDVTMRIDGVCHQHVFRPWEEDFCQEIAPARSFARLQDVQALQDAGYIRGASLQTGIALHKGQPVNAGGWRLPDECARHKILDMMGDLGLLGAFLYADIVAVNTGHTLNHKACVALMEHPDAYRRLSSSQLAHRVAQPAFGAA